MKQKWYFTWRNVKIFAKSCWSNEIDNKIAIKGWNHPVSKAGGYVVATSVFLKSNFKIK